jgi:glycosyltransferase involved in cell wall biosynthesis
MKGAVLFLALLNFYFQDRRIRVLGGGYNSAVSKMRPFLGGIQSGLYHGDIPENLDVQDTLLNMTEVYETTEVLLHPTRIEGFGMTPAEALLEGCGVITTDLPGIRESVGDAAVKMPYFADPTDWAKAVDAMLNGEVDLEGASRARAAHLNQRQRSELAELKTLFEETIGSRA